MPLKSSNKDSIVFCSTYQLYTIVNIQIVDYILEVLVHKVNWHVDQNCRSLKPKSQEDFAVLTLPAHMSHVS
jgi:hypothetical protein